MADEVTPAAAPEAPAAPVAPEAPAAPVTPEPTAAEQSDDAEWAAATDELFPGIQSAKKDNKNEPAKPAKDPAAPEAPEVDPNETPEAKAEREAKEAADEAARTETATAQSAARDSRLVARQTQQELSTLKSDVRTKMFTQEVDGKQIVTTPDGSKYRLDPSGKPTLTDGDGDLIRTIEDVMGLVNPRTGQAFTEEEAATWLLQAQQALNKNITDMETQSNEIAELNLDIKDQADIISGEYGELLKALPEVRQQVWAEYEKTLVKDEKTGIITKAPVSLERFYRTALEPYAALARKLEADEQAASATPAAPAPDPAAAEQARRAARADRSDIYGGGKTDTMDEDEKEWSSAATAVFGPMKK